MLQIIYAWDYVEWGGAQIYYFTLMREACKKYKVTALVPENSSPRIFDHLRQLNIDCELLPRRERLRTAAGLLEKIRMHRRKLSYENNLVKQLSERNDLTRSIVHIDMGFWQSFLTLARLAQTTNVFVTVHTGLPVGVSGLRELLWKIKGKIISRFRNFHLMASNLEAKRSLYSYLTKEKADSIVVAYSGFDPDEMKDVSSSVSDRRAICSKYGLPDNKFLIFSAGQFIERKGCWVVLESLRRLQERSDLFFVWLGTLALDDTTKEIIKDYDVADSFRYLYSDEIGEKRADLLGLLNIADVFVLASFQEGLPIALIEAMALGRPCVATNVNAIPEAVENMQTGVLIEPGDPEKLSDAITELMENSDLRSRLASEARKKAFSKFNGRNAADITVKLYDEVLA